MREKIRKKIGAICLYVCLFFLMIVVIDTKENYHGDEIFTYGLSNHNNGITMKPQRAPYSYAPAINAYLEYMTVEKGEEFQFSNVWANQAQDVHPPLYYSIIHFLSSLYSGKFTKWIAGGVNILFMLLTFFVFRKIMDFYKIEGKDKVIFSLFFVLNTGILMAVSFFRMYVVVMFEVTLITWLILKFKGNEKLKFYIALLSISIVGALTHYYFIVYLFFVCLFYGIFLLSNKRWVNVLYLILTMTCAGFLAFLIFPEMIQQIFGTVGGRGEESFDNFQKGLDIWIINIKEYFKVYDKTLFGGVIFFLLFLLLFIGIYKMSENKRYYSYDREKIWDVIIGFLPSVGYFFLIAKIAVYNTERYAFPIFATMILVVLYGIKKVIKFLFQRDDIYKIVFGTVCAIMIASNWKTCSWKFLYLDSAKLLNKMDNYNNVDGLYIGDTEWKMHRNFFEVSKLRSVTFFGNNIEILAEMDDLNNQSDYVLFVMENNDVEKIVNQIFQICPQINSYEKLGSYGYTTSYYLYGSN